MKKKLKLLGCMAVLSCISASANDTNSTDFKNNFYQAVNNKWLQSNTIDDDKGGVSTFSVANDAVVKKLGLMIENLKKKKTLTHNEQILLHFYTSFFDMNTRNAQSIQAIVPDLERIEAIKDKKALLSLIAQMDVDGVGSFYSFGLKADDENASKYMLEASQPPFGLEKKYYEEETEVAKKKRSHHKTYLHDKLTLAKVKDINASVEKIMQLSKLLSKISWTKVQMRDVQLTRNPSTVEKMAKTYPHIGLAEYFKLKGYPAHMKMNIAQPSYFKGLDAAMQTLPLDSCKSYLKSALLKTYSNLLDQGFVDAALRYNQSEGLIKQLQPMDIRALNTTSRMLQLLMGDLYVATYFDKNIKKDIATIIQSIVDEYRIAITNTSRFSPNTKKAALKKINNMVFNIAYPKNPKDYSTLNLKADDLVYNFKQLVKMHEKWDREKLKRGTVGREEWGMGSQEINAYYDPTANKFVVLAAILEKPFYDANGTKAQKYGGIGMIIGHEIGHAFDASGAQYDDKGNLKNWWNKEDSVKFKKLQNALIKQADSFEVLPGLHANGKLEIGEIMADLSGVEIALRAYEKSEKKEKVDMPAFFKQFASLWRNKKRPGIMRRYNDIDVHPNGKYRVNGTLKNVAAFYKTFDIKKGDGMYMVPQKHVRIW